MNKVRHYHLTNAYIATIPENSIIPEIDFIKSTVLLKSTNNVESLITYKLKVYTPIDLVMKLSTNQQLKEKLKNIESNFLTQCGFTKENVDFLLEQQFYQREIPFIGLNVNKSEILEFDSLEKLINLSKDRNEKAIQNRRKTLQTVKATLTGNKIFYNAIPC